MDQKALKNQNLSCLNCGAPISLANKHCNECGQKTKPPKLTVWVVVKDFFARVFDLDSKFFKSFKDVFIPAKLTKAYIAGKREDYYNPIRILFVAMLVHFAILGYMVTKDVGESLSTENDKKETYQMDLAAKIDSLAPSYLNKQGEEDLDSLLANLSREKFKDSDNYFLSGGNIGDLYFDSLKIKSTDVFDLSETELADKYEITEFKRRFLFTQFIKIYKDPKGLPAFLIGNSIWTVIIVILFIALILKIIYIRQFYYYVEHLILLIHIHSTCFIIASICFLLSFILETDERVKIIDHGLTMDSIYTAGAFILSVLFMYVSFLAYYKQGFIKTAIKLFIVSMAYSLVLLFAALIVSLLSVAFF